MDSVLFYFQDFAEKLSSNAIRLFLFFFRVLAEKVASKVTDGDSVELFTFNWEQNSILTDELHQLFLLIRYCIDPKHSHR